MMTDGTIVAFIGSDAKAGTSAVAKSFAECIAQETGESVLFLGSNGGTRVVLPRNGEEMDLTEAGLSFLAPDLCPNTYPELRERFAYVIADVGAGGITGADRFVFVVNQLASSIRAAKSSESGYLERFGPERNEDRILCVNRFLSADPHSIPFFRERFPDWRLFTVPESARGREADWENKTIFELGDRAFRRAVKEGVKWILED